MLNNNFHVLERLKNADAKWIRCQYFFLHSLSRHSSSILECVDGYICVCVDEVCVSVKNIG